MSLPEVSVIITNFNRDEELQKAVRSVLEQKEVSTELIIVDDASTNPPVELYARLAQAGHKLLFSKSRQGPGPCRNWGASLAEGRYIALLDSDDYWLPTKLSLQLQSLKTSKMRIGQVEEVWILNGTRINPPKVHRWEAGDLFQRSLKAVCISPSSVMLEKRLYQEHEGFDKEFFVCEDYELWLRITAKEKVDLVSQALTIKFGGHKDQLSRALPAMDRFRLLAMAKGLNSQAFVNRYPLVQNEIYRKAEIVAKGALKRGFQEAIERCQHIIRLTQAMDWVELENSCRSLCALWPLKPA